MMTDEGFGSGAPSIAPHPHIWTKIKLNTYNFLMWVSDGVSNRTLFFCSAEYILFFLSYQRTDSVLPSCTRTRQIDRI